MSDGAHGSQGEERRQSLAILCLDASDGSLGAEDFPGVASRWHLQRELAATATGAAVGGAPAASQQFALVTAACGRAAVALHPTSDVGAVRAALDGAQPSGEGNLLSSLKLALLLSRRQPAGSTHVTAFVASEGGAASLAAAGPQAAAELKASYQAAGISLDVAALCSQQELGSAAAEALEALAGSPEGEAGTSCGSSSGGTPPLASEPEAASTSGSDGEASVAPAGRSPLRLLWLRPVETAVESWQQLEPALELLEGGGAGAGSSSRGSRRSARRAAARAPAGDASAPAEQRSALPQRISRGPRQFDPLRHPRTALLARRSGLQQPALCRGESLSRLGHLSSDGMMRPWLPTYSSIGQQAAAAASAGAAAAGSGGGGGEMVYVEVQPIPKWRTLLKVSAGRMQAAGGASAEAGSQGNEGSEGSDGSPRSGGASFASASAKLLSSLQSFSLEDGPEWGQGGSSSGGTGGSEAAAPAPPAPVRFLPDPRRGTLRLLQATKEPHLLKLVWSPEPSAAAGAVSSDSAGTCPAVQPLDMFGLGTGGASSGSGSSSGIGRRAASSARNELLSFMPAAAVATAAARGPLVREGCELWEAAAEFEWELSLPTAERDDEPLAAGAGADSAAAAAPAAASADAPVAAAAVDSNSAAASAAAPASEHPALPAAFEARRLPNGSQLLVVTPASPGRRSVYARLASSGPPEGAALFWLQESLGKPGSLDLPLYGTLSKAASSPGAAAEAAPDAAVASSGASGSARPAAVEASSSQPEPAGQAAERLAAAMLSVLRQPPRVDLRRLRRDVKDGAIQITPITVGPLPAQFVRDMVSARSAMLSGMGVENLDSWEGNNGSSSSSSSKAERSASASSSGGEEGGQAGAATAAPAGPAPGPPADGKGEEEALQRHKAAAYSLLRKRLQARPPARGVSGGDTAALAPAKQPSATAPSAGDAGSCEETAVAGEAAADAAGTSSAAAAIPCSSPQPTPQPPHRPPDSCGSSAAGTPFGTPMQILPSRLLHQRGSSVEAGGASSGAEGTPPASEGSEGAAPGLPVAGDECVKREGSAVLVAGGGRAEGAGEGMDPLFQLE